MLRVASESDASVIQQRLLRYRQILRKPVRNLGRRLCVVPSAQSYFVLAFILFDKPRFGL